MKSSETFSILFWLYTQGVDQNFAYIYARITINSKRTNISLKRKIEVLKWDSKKSKAKGNSQESRLINQFLDNEKSKINNAFQELSYEKKLVTSKLVKARYLGLDKKHKTLQDLVTYHNQLVAQKIHKDTLRSYKTSQKYLFSYVNERLNTNDLYLKELDFQFLLGFETYLREYRPTNGQFRIQNNTVMKHIQRLRKMIRTSVEMEWLNKDPFVRSSPTIEKKTREYLTEVELNNILEYDTTITRLELVKDLFVFSCYSGLSYVDIINLKQVHLVRGIDGGHWLFTKRQKTGTSVKVPLIGPTEELIIKYKDDIRAVSRAALFPKLSNQKINSYLKEIADICGIKKNLTFHMARHTFATTVTLTNGVPIESVSKMLGHTKIATTQIYAKVVESKVSEDMNRLRNILEDKRNQNKSNKTSSIC